MTLCNPTLKMSGNFDRLPPKSYESLGETWLRCRQDQLVRIQTYRNVHETSLLQSPSMSLLMDQLKRISLIYTVACMLAAAPLSLCAADDENVAQVTSPFARDVAPFLEMHCVSCHGGNEPEGELALDRYHESANVPQDFEVWQRVLRMLGEGEMPPEDEPQPTAAEVRAVLQAIKAELDSIDCSQPHPGRVTLRRLNRAEYNNTIRDLVGINFEPANDFPSDDVGNGFDNMADVLTIPPILLEKYLAAAEDVVQKAFGDEAARNRILVHKANNNIDPIEAARRNLRAFAQRAFRRPVSDEEIDRIFAVMKVAWDNGSSPEETFQVGLQIVLASPHFLFRVELDPDENDVDGIRELNDYEIASRLSYFLWSSMPDEELFSLAEQKSLHEPDVLRQQVTRMLKDPKADALVQNFAGQWLQLRDLEQLTPDPEIFADFDDALRRAMRRETEMFFAAMIREDRGVLDFLGADFTYVNERLARHYGIDGVQGDEFQRVRLGARRRGVLTHGSILLLTSNPTRTSPVKRGKWILDNILDEPPPPPPDNVPELDEAADEIGSLRERLEQHRSNESCAICHRRMDPLGFGLENFDAVGAWRDRDGKFEIDASGTLPGNLVFGGPQELMGILIDQKKEEFCRCLAKKLLTYAIGRGLEPFDRCAVDKIVTRLAAEDYRLSSLVTAVVMSDPFLLRELPGEE